MGPSIGCWLTTPLAYDRPVDFEWDHAKNLSNQRQHGLSFAEVQGLFQGEVDVLEIFDAEHSDSEDRFIAIGAIDRGLGSRRLHRAGGGCGPNHRCPVRHQERADAVPLPDGSIPMSDIPELTEEQLLRSIPRRLRNRLMNGRFEAGDDIAALRSFVGLTQEQFARAVGISVHTLRNWEQGRRKPEGPAIALLRIAARHPRIIRESLDSAS